MRVPALELSYPYFLSNYIVYDFFQNFCSTIGNSTLRSCTHLQRAPSLVPLIYLEVVSIYYLYNFYLYTRLLLRGGGNGGGALDHGRRCGVTRGDR